MMVINNYQPIIDGDLAHVSRTNPVLCGPALLFDLRYGVIAIYEVGDC